MESPWGAGLIPGLVDAEKRCFGGSLRQEDIVGYPCSPSFPDLSVPFCGIGGVIPQAHLLSSVPGCVLGAPAMGW